MQNSLRLNREISGAGPLWVLQVPVRVPDLLSKKDAYTTKVTFKYHDFTII